MGILRTAVTWAGYLALAAFAVQLILFGVSLVGRVLEKRFVNLQSDSEFFAGATGVVVALVLVLVVLMAAAGWGVAAVQSLPAKAFFMKATLAALGGIGISVALFFLGPKFLGGGILPH